MAATVSIDPIYAGIVDDTLLDLDTMHSRQFPNLAKNATLLGSVDGNRPTLTYAIDKFVHYKTKQKSWSSRTETEFVRAFNWFKEVLGPDRFVDTLKNGDIADFQDNLLNMPKAANQKLKTKAMLAALAAKTDTMETLSNKAVQKYMIPIRSFIKWAADEDKPSRSNALTMPMLIGCRAKISLPRVRLGIAMKKIILLAAVMLSLSACTTMPPLNFSVPKATNPVSARLQAA